MLISCIKLDLTLYWNKDGGNCIILSIFLLQHAKEDLVIPEAKKQKLDMPHIAEEAPFKHHSQDVELHRQLLHSLSPVSSSSIAEHQKDQEYKQMEEEDIVKSKAVVNEKDMEILMLKSKLEASSKEREIMVELAFSMSENISRLEIMLQNRTDLKEANTELQEMKTKLQDAKLQLGISVSNVMEAKESRFELERENMYIDSITIEPTILDLLEKQQRLKEWVLETSSIPPSVLPSDSGLATSIADVSEGGEPLEDFEQQFLQELAMKREEIVKKEEAQKRLLEDLAMKREEIVKKEEAQKRLLGDLAMKQEELKRKEEEIERLREELEKANSDKSKVYSERLGEAEQFQKNIRELETVLKTKNEEVMGLADELQHLHQQMEALRSCDEKDLYRMEKNPHGICVIFDNHEFYHPTDPDKALPNRGGAEVDLYNLRVTFEWLRYRVVIYKNYSHTLMMDVMCAMAQRNHAEYDSFVCCILTHGEENIIYGANSIPLSLIDLTGVMKMCKTLINKPKMFFIQCTRGDREDQGHKLEVVDKTIPQDLVQHPGANAIHQEADFFFGYATPLGYAAYRSRRHGSWYISELCKALTTQGYTSNLSNIMKKVNNNTNKAFTKEGYKQTAEVVDRLRKDVHFFHFSKSNIQQQQEEQSSD